MARSGFHGSFFFWHWTKPEKIAIANQSPCAEQQDIFHGLEIQLAVRFLVSSMANSSNLAGEKIAVQIMVL